MPVVGGRLVRASYLQLLPLADTRGKMLNTLGSVPSSEPIDQLGWMDGWMDGSRPKSARLQFRCVDVLVVAVGCGLAVRGDDKRTVKAVLD